MIVSSNALVGLMIFGLLIVAALVLFLPRQRPRTMSTDRRGSEIFDRRDSRYWFAGVFYYNPDDPDAIVPKRFGLGWTINVAHPWGKVCMAIVIAMILLPVALSLFGILPANSSIGCHPSGCHLTP